MAYSILLGAVLALLVAAVVQLLYKNFYRLYYSAYKLPPGNLGVPVIGSTFSLLRACRSNTDDQWFRDRIKKYGPVSTMSLFGSPTVLLAGPAANHFIFGNEGLILTQTGALRALVGRSVLALTGSELKLVRSALQGYLKPEMVRRYVCKIDHEVRSHIELNWVGRDSVTVWTNAYCMLDYIFHSHTEIIGSYPKQKEFIGSLSELSCPSTEVVLTRRNLYEVKYILCSPYLVHFPQLISTPLYNNGKHTVFKRHILI